VVKKKRRTGRILKKKKPSTRAKKWFPRTRNIAWLNTSREGTENGEKSKRTGTTGRRLLAPKRMSRRKAKTRDHQREATLTLNCSKKVQKEQLHRKQIGGFLPGGGGGSFHNRLGKDRQGQGKKEKQQRKGGDKREGKQRRDGPEKLCHHAHHPSQKKQQRTWESLDNCLRKTLGKGRGKGENLGSLEEGGGEGRRGE